MIESLGLDAHWLWLILGAVLITIEIVAPGFFLMWIGFAALLTGVAALGFGFGLGAQLGTFAVLAIGSVAAGRHWFLRHPIATTDPLLNIRAARVIGDMVTVVEPIAGGEGRVRVGDGVWSARGHDAPVGARVRVVGVDGNCLRVERSEERTQIGRHEAAARLDRE